MDSEFEKELLKIQLQALFDKYDESKVKAELISCVDFIFKKEEEDKPTVDKTKSIKNVCQICESSDFYMSNSEEICRQCGNIHRVVFNAKTDAPKAAPNFVARGDNKISLLIDGKKVNVDIDKISRYTMTSLTPHQRIFKSGKENIEEKLTETGINYTEDELNLALAMYWNITLYYDKFKTVTPSIKPNENKRVYQALSVYYGLGKKIDIFKIARAFDVTITNIEYFNQILKIIFNKTNYISLLEDSIQPIEYKKISNLAVRDKADKLIEKLVPSLFKEITPEIYAAVAIYVARDILKLKYTNKEIMLELGVNQLSKVNLNYKKLTNYLKENPRLLTIL